MDYPDGAAARTGFVLERRGPKNAADPERAYSAFVEDEPDGRGGVARIATVLLTNRECPWHCVFCDLWRSTLDATVPAGAITAQIRSALAELPETTWIKLYNAGSFFDPRAIPPAEMPALADLLSSFERVIVESHPKLVGDGALRFRDALSGRLEIAMGLETADPSLLALLNKGMTLEDFERAAELLREEGIDVRAFVLVQPPFVRAEDAIEDAVRAAEFAEDCGAHVVSLLPTRGGNGALEALREQGEFAPPRLSTLEEAFDRGLQQCRSRVFADVWELETFADCSACFPARKDRLTRMNLSQVSEPRVACPKCG